MMIIHATVHQSSFSKLIQQKQADIPQLLSRHFCPPMT